MQTITETDIVDFSIRGNYSRRRGHLASWGLHGCKRENFARYCPGYCPPVVDFELQGGGTGSIVISESDIPLLYNGDTDKGKRYLCLIHDARQGDTQAAMVLRSALQEYASEAANETQPSESCFVVPCTSRQSHSEEAISQKAFTLLRLSQRGYPVPEFVVLTAQAYEDRDQHLEKHLADAITALEILTAQELRAGKNPLVFAIRCATGHYIPGVMDTYLNVGVTEGTLPSLEATYGCFPARKMFLNNLRNLCRLLNPEVHAAVVSAVRADLPADETDRLVEQLSDIVRKADRKLLEDPYAQAEFVARQAYKHFEENQELVVTLCRGTEHYPSPSADACLRPSRWIRDETGCLRARTRGDGRP